MRKFIIASHGKMAEGLVDTLELIIGKQDNIYCFSFYSETEESEIEIKNNIYEFLKKNYENDIFVLTDLLGGSVNQYFISLLSEFDFKLFAGVNLPLLLEIILDEKSTANHENIVRTVENSSKNLVYVNDVLTNIEKSGDE